ncbi:unnamed protein product, partial [Ectocarpus fasciculatus]
VRGVLQYAGSPTASSSFSSPRVNSLPSVAVAAGAGKAPQAAPFSQMDLNEVEVVVSCSSETTNTMTTAAASESDSPRRRCSSDEGGVAGKGG